MCDVAVNWRLSRLEWSTRKCQFSARWREEPLSIRLRRNVLISYHSAVKITIWCSPRYSWPSILLYYWVFSFFSRCVESISIIYPFYVDVFSIQVRLCSGSRHPLNRSENLLLSHLRRCLRFSISPEGLSSLRWKISSAQRLSTTSVSKEIRDGACCFHSWDWTSYLSPSEVCWAKLNEITLIFSLSLV